MNHNFVRVAAENGYHVTVTESFAKSKGLTVLDEEATDRRGRPLPEAPATAAAKKAAAAPPKKRAAKKTTAKKAAGKPAPQPVDNPPSGSANAASNQEENQ